MAKAHLGLVVRQVRRMDDAQTATTKNLKNMDPDAPFATVIYGWKVVPEELTHAKRTI
jgi:hypothetical protein